MIYVVNVDNIGKTSDKYDSIIKYKELEFCELFNENDLDMRWQYAYPNLDLARKKINELYVELIPEDIEEEEDYAERTLK